MLLQMAKIFFHIFLIHSSVRGYLGCFHILAIVNNAAMNVEGQAPFQVSVFIFFKYPEVELLDPVVVRLLPVEPPCCFP